LTSFLGIDPGASGGLAYVTTACPARAVSAATLTLQETWEWLQAAAAVCNGPAFAVLEKVGGYVAREGPQPGSAMFNFGASYGGLRAFLVAAAVPFEEITPQVWQRKLGVTPRAKDEPKAVFKRRLKERAQSLYPDLKVTLATCDALLIATYCMRKHTGTL
jgi:hypothetical protein